MATTSKPKQNGPASTRSSPLFDALKHMVIPLKEKEVKISISKTNPGCFELNINGEVQGTQIGPGFDLLITQSAIEFRPQEIKIDNTSVTSVPLQTETPREQPTQQKTLDNPPEPVPSHHARSDHFARCFYRIDQQQFKQQGKIIER
jgi:hypothetical protein